MLIGAVKGLREMSEHLIDQSLLPMIKAVWPKILGIIQARAQEPELVQMACNLVQRSITPLA